MKDAIVSILLVLGAAGWAEFREWFPWFAKRMIALAVAALAPDDRARMKEELFAEVAAIPGKLSPLLFACNLCWGFWRPVLVAKADMSASRYAIRASDMTLASLMLIWTSPLMLVCVVAVRISGPGPVIYVKRQVGRNNKEFRRMMFRTWNITARKHSRAGLFLQKTGLEVLPNLINVLRGDMSLVGPPPRASSHPDVQSIDLRPGLIWFSPSAACEAEEFGHSTFKTIKQYFRLLGQRLVGLIWRGPNSRE